MDQKEPIEADVFDGSDPFDGTSDDCLFEDDGVPERSAGESAAHAFGVFLRKSGDVISRAREGFEEGMAEAPPKPEMPSGNEPESGIDAAAPNGDSGESEGSSDFVGKAAAAAGGRIRMLGDAFKQAKKEAVDAAEKGEADEESLSFKAGRTIKQHRRAFIIAACVFLGVCLAVNAIGGFMKHRAVAVDDRAVAVAEDEDEQGKAGTASVETVAKPQTYRLCVKAAYSYEGEGEPYGVVVYVDGKRLGTVDQDSSDSKYVYLESGTHKLSVSADGNGLVKATETFDLGETESTLSFSALCTNQDISIVDLTVKTAAQVKEEEAAKAEEEAAKAAQEEEAQRQAEEAAAAEQAQYEATHAPAPKSSYLSWSTYDEAVSAYTAAGFTNVTTTPVYDLNSETGGVFGGRANATAGITIGGSDSYSEGDWFDKDAPVVIKYHVWKYADPSIVYNSCSVKELLDDFSANALRAKNNHTDEYVLLEGYVGDIDSDGYGFTLQPSKDSWNTERVYVSIKTDGQKSTLMNYSKNDYIKMKAKITSVDSLFTTYWIDLIEIV